MKIFYLVVEHFERNSPEDLFAVGVATRPSATGPDGRTDVRIADVRIADVRIWDAIADVRT